MTGALATTEAQGVAQMRFDPEKVALIRAQCAAGCTDNEFGLLCHLAQTYRLDPMARQIWAVKYGNAPAQIFVGRDGYLAIAHQSGKFDGMESGVRIEDGEMIGWAKVYRKDMKVPFSVEVARSEYDSHKSVWKDKPRTMIQKVAEAQALRRAFGVSGVYSPEEIHADNEPREIPYTPAPSGNVCEICGGEIDPRFIDRIREESGRTMCRPCFDAWYASREEAEE